MENGVTGAHYIICYISHFSGYRFILLQ